MNVPPSTRTIVKETPFTVKICLSSELDIVADEVVLLCLDDQPVDESEELAVEEDVLEDIAVLLVADEEEVSLSLYTGQISLLSFI